MNRLKNVHNRRDDALPGVRWNWRETARVACLGVFPIAVLVIFACFLPNKAVAQDLSAQQKAYGQAIQTLIESAWRRPADMPEDAVCRVKISQIVGGDIVGLEFTPECNFDVAGKASVEKVIKDVGALPYWGFQGVFERVVYLRLKASGTPGSLTRYREAQIQREKDEDASRNKRYRPRVGGRFKGYVDRCIAHIQETLQSTKYKPKLPEVREAEILICSNGVIDHVMISGFGPSEDWDGDRRFIIALQSIQGCEPFTDEMRIDTDTLRIPAVIKTRK